MTPEEILEAYKKADLKKSEFKEKEVCPHCGYCPHCGRSGHYTYPYPWYPYYWEEPYKITWTYEGTTGGL